MGHNKINVILVTGGSGQLGKELKRLIPDATYVSSKDYDLTDYNQTETMFKELRPNIVIHCAALVGQALDNIERPNDYYVNNIKMNTFVVDLSLKYGVEALIAVSSTEAYPSNLTEYPIKEEMLHKGEPGSGFFSYSITKRAMCVHIDSIRVQYNKNYCYINPSNMYGVFDKLDYKSHFISALLRKIRDAEISGDDNITLFGTGEPLRQFINASDVAKVIHAMIEGGIYENMNVATEDNISVNDAARDILNSLGLGHITIKYDTTKPNGQYRKDVSIDKFRSFFPEFEFRSFIDGIKETYNKLYK